MIDKNTQDKLKQLRHESEERVAQNRAVKFDKKYVDLSKTSISTEALALIPEETAKKAQIVAIQKQNENIAIAAFDPTTAQTTAVIASLETQGLKPIIYVCSVSSLEYAFEFYKFVSQSASGITGNVAIKHNTDEILQKTKTISGFTEILNHEEFLPSRAKEILEIVLNGAMSNRASDIHLEPTEFDGKLRLRIDGNLREVFTFSKQFYPYLITRIKLLSNLKLNVNKEAQDGRFTINFPNKNVEVRVAVAPAQFGEVIVMRLLDPDSINISLNDLGLREDDLAIIEKQLKQPNGIILNTGPTGSGKTTTLYAFLKAKKSPEIKIITIEDPIEYHLDGIEQTQVNNETGYTFANGLRSLMRQDPDVILVGEIRDKETAEIGIQAALTGHLVFSTIHANSAAGAIPRLVDLGVKAISINPALNLIIGQRLVRRLCKECKIESKLDEEIKSKIEKFISELPERVNKEKYKNITMYEPGSCEICNGTGYKGRVAIYELLVKTPDMETLITNQAGELEYAKFAKEHQLTSMQEDGILKVINGITTFSEVEDVAGTIEWLA